MDRVSKDKGVDFESWEFGLRQAVLSAGAKLLEEMLDGLGSGQRSEPALCSCGCRMESRGRKKKGIKTILGDIHFKRSVFVCPDCGASRIPGDELLDVIRTGLPVGKNPD